MRPQRRARAALTVTVSRAAISPGNSFQKSGSKTRTGGLHLILTARRFN
jgi:hypothetical protein